MLQMTPYPEIIRTPRLLLSRIRDTDFPDLMVMQRDERVMVTLGGFRPLKEWQDRHQWNMDHWREHGFGWWIARDPATLQFIGRGGLRRALVDGKDEVELGYGLMPEFWGLGLAGEIAEASVRAGFDELGLREIVCFALPTNHRSRRVMEKIGFHFEKDMIWGDLPHVLYRLRRQD